MEEQAQQQYFATRPAARERVEKRRRVQAEMEPLLEKISCLGLLRKLLAKSYSVFFSDLCGTEYLKVLPYIFPVIYELSRSFMQEVGDVTGKSNKVTAVRGMHISS